MRTLSQLMDMRGRVALITGGAGHIGQAAAEALAEMGAAVAVLDLDSDKCEGVCEDLRKRFPGQTMPLAVDLAEAEVVRAVPAKVVGRLGRLDVLIHCAALVGTSSLKGWAVPFADQSLESWRSAMDVNLASAFVLAQAAAEALGGSGCGSIINVSSIYGLVGPDMRLYAGTTADNPAAYGASKAGLLQLTRYLATVLAPKVRVNAITPGGVLRGQDPEFQKRYVSRTPLGRMAVEEDLKGAFAYLASDLSAYVTGQNLVVDGGWTAW